MPVMPDEQETDGETRGVPVIGLLGAPGSGKSTIARDFAALGCVVIDADQLSREAMLDPRVLETLAAWWGDGVVVDGRADRRRIGEIVFADAGERQRLEGLIHPYVNRWREAIRQEVFAHPSPMIPAIVEDCPLLIEAGLAEGCDVLVFVDTPLEERQARVQASRGWSAEELAEREAAQAPLDTKRSAADHILYNVGDRETIRSRVADVLNDILQAFARGRTSRHA